MSFKKGNTFGVRTSKTNKPAVKHSLHTFRRMLEGAKVDGRTSLYRVLREKEQELITAHGGDPSPQERLIIADAVKTLLYVGTLDEYLMALDGGIVGKGKVIPVVDTRTKLAGHLREDLRALGLHRRVKALSLHDLLTHDENENPDKPVTSNGKAD
ncbi:MAG TPA: hypothetical protein VF977_05740 [Candidatus Binatia bacterium]